MIEYYSKVDPSKLLHVVVRKEDLKPGSVKCIFYDLDDTLLVEPILYPGDASFTLEGGHNYEILEDDTLVYEYKTGPYEGQALDKTFLNG